MKKSEEWFQAEYTHRTFKDVERNKLGVWKG